MARIKFKLRTVLLIAWTGLLLIPTASAGGMMSSTTFWPSPPMPPSPTYTTPDMGHIYGTVCQTGSVYCFVRRMCVNEDGTCLDNPAYKETQCGHDESYCFARHKCVKNKCDDGGGWTPGPKVTTCAHDESYCFARRMCVKNKGCDDGGGWTPGPKVSTCAQDESYCFARQMCVKNKGCDDGGGWTPGPKVSTCAPDESYCFARQMCVKNKGCDDGGGWTPGPKVTTCAHNESYCFARQMCVKNKGCDDGGGWTPGPKVTTCAHDESYCFARHICVKNKRCDDGGGWTPGPNVTTCAHDESYCFARQMCVKNNKCDDGGGWTPGPKVTTCAHDESYCFARQICVKNNRCDNGGGWTPGPNVTACAYDESYCFARQICVKNNRCDNGGGWTPGPNVTACAHDESYCFARRMCVKNNRCDDGGGWTPGPKLTTCAHDEVYCIARGGCVSARCFEDPCSRNELLGWIEQRYELEGCFDRCNGSEFVCMENGGLVCVEEEDQCSYIRVSLVFHHGMPHDAFVVHGQEVLMQFSESSLINTNQMWMLESWADPENEFATIVAFNVPLEATPLVEAAFNSLQPAVMIVEGDLAVEIVWSRSEMVQHPIQEVVYYKYLFRIPLLTRGINIGFAWHYSPNLASNLMTLVPEVTDVGFILHGSRTDKVIVYAEYTSITSLDTDQANEMLTTVGGHLVNVVLGQQFFTYSTCVIDDTDTDGPSVTLLNDDASVVVYAYSRPVVPYQEEHFTMEDIVPEEDFPSIPEQAIMDCSATPGVTVKSGDQEFSSMIDVLNLKTDTITVHHTLSEHRFVTCEVWEISTGGKRRKREGDDRYYVGFLAIPDKIGEIKEIQGPDDFSFSEDSPRVVVPEDTFSSIFYGDELADDLASGDILLTDGVCMVCNIDHKQGLSTVAAMEALAFDIHVAMNDSMNNFRATATMGEYGPADVTLYYKGEPLLPTTPLPILPYIYNMAIQASENYFGEFVITFHAMESDLSFDFPVQVQNVPDEPERLNIDFSEGSSEFTFEMDQAFTISHITGLAFYDADDEDIAMLLFGTVESADTVSGEWAYSMNSGESWEPINSVSEISEDGTLEAIGLSADFELRFTPSIDVPDAWLIERAPAIAFSPLYDYQPGVEYFPVPVTQCSNVINGIEKYCHGDVNERGILLLRLASIGCDDIFNSGKTVEVCGCGDDYSCLDCAGVPNGGAVKDECDICNGGFTAIDCYDEACYNGIPEICDLILEEENPCNENEILNEHYGFCKAQCLPDGDTVFDQCGVVCGNNDCVDCNGVPNGDHDINVCGECNLISELNEGCSTIGTISPAFALQGHVPSFKVTYMTALELEPESCVLVPAGANSGVDIETTFTDHTMNSQDSTEQVTLTPVDENIEAGEYYVTCGDWSTSTTSQILTVYSQPVLTSIDPVTNSLSALQEDADAYWVTITGTGFIDTGNVHCFVSCEELGLSCGGYKGAPGIRLDESNVECPAGLLGNFGQGKVYHVFISPENSVPDGVDGDVSWFSSNSMAFEVSVPAPQPDKAKLSRDGCNKMTIKFDRNINIQTDNDTKCSNYMDIADTATCTVSSDSLTVTYQDSIAPDTPITFKDDKIYSENDFRPTPTFLTDGSVVTTRNPKVPSATIGKASNLVGCDGVYLKTKFKKKGCWDYTIEWTESSGKGLVIEDSFSKKIHIAHDDLLDSETYTINMRYEYTAPEGELISQGYDEKELTKTAEAYILTIYGDTEDVGPTNEYRASVTKCGDSVEDVEFKWYLNDQLYSSKPRISLADYSSHPATTYTLKCDVSVTGVTVTDSIDFTTADREIDAAVLHDGDVKSFFEVDPGEESPVQCVDLNGYTDITCVWMCVPGHTYSDVPPCVEINSETNTRTKWIATGQSVNIPSVPESGDNGLVVNERKYQVIVIDGSINSTAQFTVETKSSSETDLEQPVIIIKGDLSTPGDPIEVSKKKTLKFKVKVKYASYYTWLIQTEDEGNGISPLDIDIDANVKKGMVHSNISYTKKKTSCTLKVKLKTPRMEEGQIYSITFTASNVDHKEQHIYYVRIPEPPTAGDVEVVTIDESTNEYRVIMTGWSHYEDFICNGYYQSVLDGSEESPIQINTLSSSPAAGFDFHIDLEGEYWVLVECCIDDNCVSASASENIVVTGAIDVIGMVLYVVPFYVTVADDSLLSSLLPVLLAGFETADTSSYTEDEVSSANAALYDSVNVAIVATLQVCFTTENTMVTLSFSVAIVIQCESYIDGTTLNSMVNVAGALLDELTGGFSLQRRRKRSIESSSAPQGLSEEEATTLLSTYVLSYDEEDPETFINAIGDIMIGMVQQFDDSYVPSVAATNLAYIQVYGTNMTGYDIMAYDIIPDDSTSSEIEPVTIMFGDDISSMYEYMWECTIFFNCTEIYLSTAMLAFDPYSPLAGVTPSTRMSDILVAYLINPETYAAESISDLTNPVEVTFILEGTVDMDEYDYKCLMFDSTAWEADYCSADTPQLESSNYIVKCSCTSLGIVAVFQEVKSEFTTTPAATTVTTTPTTTPLPFVPIAAITDYVLVSFTFYDDYYTFVISVDDFFDVIRATITDNMFITSGHIRNHVVEPGSIVVSFELHESGSGYTLGQMMYVLQDKVTSGNITFLSPNGTILTLDPSSFTYREERYTSTGSDEEEESSNVGIIVGAVIASVVIVGLIIAVVILVLKQKGIIKIGNTRNNSSIPDHPPPRYEVANSTFVMAAPPPYIYDNPLKVSDDDKWIEDEVEKKVAEIINSRECKEEPRASSSERCKSAGLVTLRNDESNLPSVS